MAKVSRVLLYLFFLFSIFKNQRLSAQADIPLDKVQVLLKNNAFALGLSAADINNVIVSSAYHDQLMNTDLVYLQQSYKGIPVYNAIQTLAFRDGKVSSIAGERIAKIESKTASADAVPVIQTASAIVAAAKNINLAPSTEVTGAKSSGTALKAEYGRLGISKTNITVELLWLPQDSGLVRLSWQVKIVPVNSPDYWLIHVDAISGKVLGKANLTVYDNRDSQKTPNKKTSVEKAGKQPESEAITNKGEATSAGTSATYRVISFPAESMLHPNGSPSLVTDPWNMTGNGNPAATLGWQNDGTTVYNITRGNNVWAKEDRANDDETTIGRSPTSSDATPNLTFDFSFDSTINPVKSPTQDFAITNLFYWNNVVHDIAYQYGFDEASGNFQNNNQGRGGKGADYVLADAQDGEGINNANFNTPPDGERPRMQMYLFSPSPLKSLLINSPASLSGYKYAPVSDFGTDNNIEITGGVALYADPTTTSIQGCSAAPAGSLTGKVVLIYRGACNYTIKVKNAQNAGAIGVIMVNNTTGNPVIMGGTDATITIPAVMISQSDGNAIRDLIVSGQAVNVKLAKGIYTDGELDNGIVVHEYAHGISTRLTGGAANSSCLDNKEQMGEGWSDYYALMLTTDWLHAQLTDGPNKRPIGTYALGTEPINGAGVRTYPYSTNMSINPWTYSMLATSTGGEEHTIGEIWAAVLWDMTWNIIGRDGIINANLYNSFAAGGNSAALKLVTTGLKLQPCSPGFLDGRDAILKADTLLYNGKYSCSIWNAFARRGMGVNAKQGSTNSYTDQTADYTVPSNKIVKKLVDKKNASENEEISYTLKATCQCLPILNYSITDTLPANVTYISGGSYNAKNRFVTFNIPSLVASDSISFVLKVRVNNGSFTPSAIVLNEPVTAASIPATFTAKTSSPYATNNWSVTSINVHSAPVAFKSVDTDSTSAQGLTSDSSFKLTGVSTLSFWHRFNTEAGYDGGIVEISTDAGASWLDVDKFIYQNGYNSVVDDGVTKRRGFSGSSNGQFIETRVNLASFSNKSIKIRFRFFTDKGVGGDGWYIDDIVLKNEAGVYNIGQLFNDLNKLQSSADTVTIIRDPATPFVWTGKTDTDWHTASNWTGGIPNQYVSALIDTVANQPVLSADASCLDLTLKKSTSLTTGNHTLTVYGSLTNSGTIKVSSSGKIVILGTKQQTTGASLTTKQAVITEKSKVAKTPATK